MIVGPLMAVFPHAVALNEKHELIHRLEKLY